MEVARQVLAIGVLECRPAGEGECRHRRSVVGLRRRDHAPPLGLAPLDVVLPREPQGGFVGLGAARDEADARHLRCSHLEQARRQALLRVVREVVVVDVRHPLRLGGGRVDHLTHAVAEAGHHRAPRAAVEQLAPVRQV